MIKLKIPVKTCDFKERELMVRDRIVLKIREKNLHECLLKESDLSLYKVKQF